MKSTHFALISCLAFVLMACDKDSTSSRSPRNAAVVDEEPIPQDGDAIPDNRGDAPQDPAAPKVDPAMALTGKDLYAKLCAACHLDFDKTEVAKTPINRLKNAIASVPDMAGLKDAKEEDLQAIVLALSEISPGQAKKAAAAEAE